jgi:proteasome beta subunit
MGYFVAHKRAKKVYKIDDHLAMTIAGGVADAQTVVEMLKANSKIYRYSHEKPMPVGAAARLVGNILFQNRYFPLLLQAIIGGIDNTGAHIFALDPLGSVTEEKYFSTGSGSPIAYGILEADYQEDMKTSNVLPIVLRAVQSAMKRDSASGDNFDVSMITLQGYYELSEEEKRSLASKAE